MLNGRKLGFNTPLKNTEARTLATNTVETFRYRLIASSVKSSLFHQIVMHRGKKKYDYVLISTTMCSSVRLCAHLFNCTYSNNLNLIGVHLNFHKTNYCEQNVIVKPF